MLEDKITKKPLPKKEIILTENDKVMKHAVPILTDIIIQYPEEIPDSEPGSVDGNPSKSGSENLQ